MKFAFASCQHFEEGWYHAHRFIAADDPDLVLFLGDYMYERASGSATRVRWYVDFDEVNYLDEYRLRYAQHHTDPYLKAVRATAPMVAVFDDHELANNPHLNYIGNHRGYVRVTADAAQLRADFLKVSSVVQRDPALVNLSIRKTFLVLDGQPGLQDP